MAKGYWIVRVDIADPEHYKRYIAANAAPFAAAGARFLVRGGPYETVEGSSRARNAVIEFPTYAAALACWHSPEYQAAMAIRTPVSTADIVIIEGYEGPQPG
jgi:uncharacterized protein (DUF1330 family)